MFWSRPNTKLASPGANGLDALRDSLARVDAVVIGAGAGLSTAAGFVYDGPRFDRYFADFARATASRQYSEGSTPSPRRRSAGPTGAGWCWSTATWTRPGRLPPAALPGAGAGLFCAVHQRRPLLSKSGGGQGAAVLHPGGLRAVPVLAPLLPADLGQRGVRPPDGGASSGICASRRSWCRCARAAGRR